LTITGRSLTSRQAPLGCRKTHRPISAS
jgi:hypothetical protein